MHRKELTEHRVGLAADANTAHINLPIIYQNFRWLICATDVPLTEEGSPLPKMFVKEFDRLREGGGSCRVGAT